ncbi:MULTISPECIES: NAD-dependent epimerase/dehydratase family protein [unclassified Amycolatopsis]|uniref:NAD-dependent epimerase/dehydratase family protein n=1 Tax=unclassified Amycolatopsis TaxID=2618356 RepID=UPI00055F90C7|nr:MULTISPECIES: NAD-dependent epimerase/dehydratase family protein [unclassified Amycolatopsis]MCG3751538.1 NAD-dependent epimerase/dehydratase family protein [Amycolatopsis sp. Poz14]
MSLQVVIGYGPAGAATAALLAEQGERVRVIGRSPREPEPGLEHVSLDAADQAALTEATKGATAIYSCASPPYHRWAADWPPLQASICAAAEANDALLVSLGNLYGYGPVDGPLTENLPLAATGTKGRIRALLSEQLHALHDEGRIRAVEVRASDFFGPGVTDGGHLAARVVPNVLRGQKVQVLGDPDASHSWTYISDVARTLVAAARKENAWGKAWHVPTGPPRSARVMVALLCEAAGVPPVPVQRLSPMLLNAAALVSPMLRELREVRYQFDRPFVLDSGAAQEFFEITPTPEKDQFPATVRWWRDRLATVS